MAEYVHYLSHILDRGEFEDDGGLNRCLAGNLLCSTGYDDFFHMSIEIWEDDSIGVEDLSRPISEQLSNSQDVLSEIALQNKSNTTTDPTITTEHAIDIVDNWPMPKGKSIAHHYFDQDQAE